jgi:hypothetical protein
MQCSECKFFEDQDEECRRYAPRMLYPKKKWLDIHSTELLHDIAWSLRTLAKLDLPERLNDLEDDVLNREAVEMSDEAWPRVNPTDWCGEFKPRK